MKEKARDLMVRNNCVPIASQQSCDLPHRFTNTAVTRFDGTGCWQQHLLVFQAIAKSNGWSPDTAALQLFAHLDGEALQVLLDRSFPYKTPGWSVDMRNGQYRTSRMTGEEHDLRRGKEGWFGREDQPPGPSVTVAHLTQVGVIVRLGNDRKMTLMDSNGPRTCRASQSWGALLWRTAAIVQYRVGWEPSGSFGGLGKSAPMANAAGRRRWVGTTGDASREE